MSRLALATLLLLLGCDVSRDLRPERFACDSGGSCGGQQQDSGVMLVNCPFGNVCTCNVGRDCAFRCTGECTIDCQVGSSCDVLCQAANCVTTCATGAECNIHCTAATCDTICESGSTCLIDCPIGASCTCSGPECPF